MGYEHILTNVEHGVGTITLNRPDKLNAMNRKLSAELHAAVKAMDSDDEVGCIVITGAGTKAFSAGGDIHEQREDDRRYTFEQLEAMREGRRAYDIAGSAKPTIGMMNGLAYGGAAVLSSSLDMRIGCEDTKFRFLAAAYGRINSTWSLGAQVGWPMAKELLPREKLRDKTMEIARMIANNHRGAVIGVKQLLLEQKGESLERAYEIEHHYTTNVMRGAKAEDAFPEFIARRGKALT
jgi:enoyl-CoA hydratase/carnithine racemase